MRIVVHRSAYFFAIRSYCTRPNESSPLSAISPSNLLGTLIGHFDTPPSESVDAPRRRCEYQ